MIGAGNTLRLGFFLPLRLATYVILMAIVVAWMKDPQYLRFQVMIYSLVTFFEGISYDDSRKNTERRINIAHMLKELRMRYFIVRQVR